jgi:hypothetical protein
LVGAARRLFAMAVSALLIVPAGVHLAADILQQPCKDRCRGSSACIQLLCRTEIAKYAVKCHLEVSVWSSCCVAAPKVTQACSRDYVHLED